MRYYKLTKDKRVVLAVSKKDGIAQYGKNRRVDLTEDKEYFVSTVFLVMDHSFDESGPPLVFETRVSTLNSREAQEMEKYSTWEEAKKGHKRMCEKWLKPQTYLPIYTGKRLITLGDENAR